MMRKAFAKLKNENGVSILMALLFMFTATMVISVILAAANTATKNFASEQKQQQAYLTVSSAATYMRDEIASYTFVSVDTDGAKTYAYDKQNSSELSAEACHFKPLMDAAVNEAEAGRTYTKNFVLSLNSTITNQRGKAAFDPVSVDFEMESDRDVSITLTIYENSETKKDNIYYQMTVSLPADSWETVDQQTDNEGNVLSTTTTTEWSWSKGSIVRG